MKELFTSILIVTCLALALGGCADDAAVSETDGGGFSLDDDASERRDSSSTPDMSGVDEDDDASVSPSDDMAKGDTAKGDTAMGDMAGRDDDPDLQHDPLGGERPARTFLPDDYDGAGSYPLVLLLHGFTASGSVQDAYFKFSGQVDERDFILVVPDGTMDSMGRRFWNATEFCCDLEGSGVDDSAYLASLVDEAKARLAVDPSRVYSVGHSNGGFMSYRLACDHPDLLAGLASLAGTALTDAERCTDPGAPAVLQIHGTDDRVINFDGTALYPGAEETVGRWVERNGCATPASTEDPLDLDTGIGGAETTREVWDGCDEPVAVELWTIDGGAHIPALDESFAPTVLDWLFEYTRP